MTRPKDNQPQLVRIRHVSIDGMPAMDLREMVQDARLVVIGGLQAPSDEAVSVLREYVEQGGQLVVAAGGQFDPVLWNQAAWRDGAGILPTPLAPEMAGKTPDEAGQQPKWFSLNNTNDRLLAHSYFQLADNSPEQLAGLYAEPLFFKAIRAEVGEEVDQKLVQAETDRLRDAFDFLDQAQARRERLATAGELGDTDRAAREQDEQQLQQLRPKWLLFGQGSPDLFDETLSEVPSQRQQQLEALAARTRFRVLAEFDNGIPFLVERSIGRGRVVLVTTGVAPQWNTLAKSYAMALFDRMLRSMIESTLSQRNYPPVEEIDYPVGDDPNLQFALYRPGHEQTAETVDAGFVGADRRAATVRNALTRGVYRLAAFDPAADGAGEEAPMPKWETRFAVRGEPVESDLTALSREQFDRRQLGDRLRWVGPGESISLAGAQVRGQDWWKYLVVAVLLLLLLELLLLGWPAYRRRREDLATT
jgi:hypothetical protein